MQTLMFILFTSPGILLLYYITIECLFYMKPKQANCFPGTLLFHILISNKIWNSISYWIIIGSSWLSSLLLFWYILRHLSMEFSSLIVHCINFISRHLKIGIYKISYLKALSFENYFMDIRFTNYIYLCNLKNKIGTYSMFYIYVCIYLSNFILYMSWFREKFYNYYMQLMHMHMKTWDIIHNNNKSSGTDYRWNVYQVMHIHLVDSSMYF